MAIFIASTKSISRGSGQSAVASASYRAGVVLVDQRYGKIHDYSKKHGVMRADIILPTVLATARATINRSELWNKAESTEKRKDARVAREWLVNLPYELNEKERKELAHSFAQTLADRYGTIADCAIHQPTQKEVDRGADLRNYHAHIMFTTRCAELDENKEITLTDKATIELSDNKRRSLGMERVSDAKTYQSELMTQLKKLMRQHKALIAQHQQMIGSHNELTAQNSQLTASLALSEDQILKLTKQLSEAQDQPQPQPQPPSMTTHDEQELLGLLSSKDDLIQKQQATLEELTTTIEQLRELVSARNW